MMEKYRFADDFPTQSHDGFESTARAFDSFWRILTSVIDVFQGSELKLRFGPFECHQVKLKVQISPAANKISH